MININKFETTERMECSTDTKLFFDDVYTNSTLTKKAQVETPQSGRSMIEMLGVLAIVGVLSVGGIAGYSKAMMQFKINKTVDQISQIATAIRTAFSQQTSYGDEYFSTELLEGIGISSELRENAFNSSMAFAGFLAHNDSSKGFTLAIYEVPHEACIKLATYDWGTASSSGLVSVAISNNGYFSASYTGYINCQGQIDETNMLACPGGNVLATPMPVAQAALACKKNNTSQFVIKFK